MYEFYKAPRAGEVYNIGGGKENSCSVLEAFDLAEKWTGRAMKYKYVEQNRVGDHICYYSDLRKMRAHYPGWDITRSLDQTIGEIVEAQQGRSGEADGAIRTGVDAK
jgi:CDP-paratose 2-epimerase